jgi:hypothetical protein
MQFNSMGTGWKTKAFSETNKSSASFNEATTSETDIIGVEGWYVDRPGFWHGAVG